MDQLAFSAYAFEKYFSTVRKAIKQVLPNHLYLGCRFWRPNYINPLTLRVAGEYCDVLSFNIYGTWDPYSDSVYWEEMSGRPLIVSEFYTKSEDSGLPNNTGAGWIVPTQNDRGHFYQNFTLQLLESRACVGWHWFRYMDNDPENKNGNSSNIDSNKGIVRINFDPYIVLLEHMKELNRQIYPLTEYFDHH